MDGYFGFTFPEEQSVSAVRAEEPGFLRLFEFGVGLKQVVADLTAHLGFKPSVVVVKILMRSITVRAADMFRHGGSFNRFKFFATNDAIVFK
jgi:hypothetical protein